MSLPASFSLRSLRKLTPGGRRGIRSSPRSRNGACLPRRRRKCARFWARTLRSRRSQAGLTTIARFTFDSADWHFVDIPLAADDYEESRDCAPSPQGDCVIHELARSLRDLTDPALTAAQRRDALKFVVHLVGDVNQPLHTVGELRGYNDLAVCYFSSPAKNDCVATNLHIVWDVGLIRSMFWDWGGYVDYLETDWLPAHNDPALDSGTPVDWALEAHKAARDVAVAGVAMDAHLGADYLAAVRPTLDRQLAVAGLRLARTLNEALK